MLGDAAERRGDGEREPRSGVEQRWRDLDGDGARGTRPCIAGGQSWVTGSSRRARGGRRRRDEELAEKRDGMLLSSNVATFSDILRDQKISMVFYGSRHLSVLNNQFSLILIPCFEFLRKLLPK